MNQETISSYKEKLEAEKANLLKDLEKGEAPVDFGSDVDGLDEEADEAEELGNRLAIGQTLRDRIEEIEMALERVAGGSYGLCITCGKEIEKEVLDVIPESEMCAHCKKSV
jgi:DnaK suppressor protein